MGGRRGTAPLVGRDAEVSVLVGVALSGRGGLGLVTGGAGSGRTRLLDEVAARVALPGVGHAMPLEDPAAVAQLIALCAPRA